MTAHLPPDANTEAQREAIGWAATISKLLAGFVAAHGGTLMWKMIKNKFMGRAEKKTRAEVAREIRAEVIAQVTEEVEQKSKVRVLEQGLQEVRGDVARVELAVQGLHNGQEQIRNTLMDMNGAMQQISCPAAGLKK